MSDPKIDWREFKNSSNVNRARYVDKEQAMDVEFKGGAVYRYFKVQKNLFIHLCNAPSAGRFLNQHVKGEYEYEQTRKPGRKDDE